MKAINIKTSHVSMPTPKIQVDITDRQPCWYANLENGTERSKAKWVVGVKKSGDEENDEYSFKVSRVGDPSDDKVWAYATSPDFAVEIIEIFRQGGKSAILKWLKEKK